MLISAVSKAAPAAPAWLSYASPVVALVALAVTVTSFVRTWHRDSQADRKQQRAEQLAYAEEVAAWTGPHADECDYLTDERARGHQMKYHFHSVVVRNGGRQPVYDVVIVVPMVPGPPRKMANVAIGLLPPGETVEAALSAEPKFASLFPAALECHFTDARGVRWQRGLSGHLKEVPQLAAPESQA